MGEPRLAPRWPAPRATALIAASAIATLFYGTAAQAQIIGGRYGGGWLALAPTASTTALGGWRVDDAGAEPALALWNPASLNAETDAVVQVGQDFLPTGVGRSVLAGGRHLGRWGLDGGAHVRYIGFGDFVGRDEAGNRTADFRAQGFSVGVSAARALAPRLRVGVGIAYVGEQIETYRANGLGLSAGLIYRPDTSDLTQIAVQVQNLGLMFDPLADRRDALPLDLSVALVRRLRYLPLRFGVTYRKLDRWNLLYDDPATRDDATVLGGEPSERSTASRVLDNLGRHLGANAELLLGSRGNFRLRFGYDRQRQQENKIRELRGLSGFSVGAGVRTRRWSLDYGHLFQHRAGGSNHLTLALDFRPAPRVVDGRR